MVVAIIVFGRHGFTTFVSDVPRVAPAGYIVAG